MCSISRFIGYRFDEEYYYLSIGLVNYAVLVWSFYIAIHQLLSTVLLIAEIEGLLFVLFAAMQCAYPIDTIQLVASTLWCDCATCCHAEVEFKS